MPRATGIYKSKSSDSDNFDLEECKKQIVEELEGTFIYPSNHKIDNNTEIDYDSDFEDKRKRIMFARRNNRRTTKEAKQQLQQEESHVEVGDIEVEMTSTSSNTATTIPISTMPAGHVETYSEDEIPMAAAAAGGSGGALSTKLAPGYHSLKVNTNYNKSNNTPTGAVSSSSTTSATRRNKILIAHGRSQNQTGRPTSTRSVRPTSTRSTMTYASTNASVASSSHNAAGGSAKGNKNIDKHNTRKPVCNCTWKTVCVFIYDLFRSLPIIPLAFAIASIYALNRISSNTRIIMNQYDSERLFENEMPTLSEIYSYLNNVLTFVVMLNIMIGCMNLFFTGATLDLFVSNFCGSTSVCGIFGRTLFSIVEILFFSLSFISSILILGATGIVCALGASFILVNTVCNAGIADSESNSEWLSMAKILQVSLNTILSWVYAEPIISINATEMGDYCEKLSVDMLSPDVETLGGTQKWRESIIYSFAAVVFQFGLTLSILRIYLTTRYTLLKMDKTKELETSQIYIEGKKMPIYKPCIEEESDLKFAIVDDYGYPMEEVKTEEPLHSLC